MRQSTDSLIPMYVEVAFSILAQTKSGTAFTASSSLRSSRDRKNVNNSRFGKAHLRRQEHATDGAGAQRLGRSRYRRSERADQDICINEADLFNGTHSRCVRILSCILQAYHFRRGGRHDCNGADGPEKDHGEIHGKYQILCHCKLYAQAESSVA